MIVCFIIPETFYTWRSLGPEGDQVFYGRRPPGLRWQQFPGSSMTDVLLVFYTRRSSSLLCLCQDFVWSIVPEDRLIYYARGPFGALWYSMTKFFLVLYDRISPGYLWMEIICLLCQTTIFSPIPKVLLIPCARRSSDFYARVLLDFNIRRPYIFLFLKIVWSSVLGGRLFFHAWGQTCLVYHRLFWPSMVKYLPAFYAKKLPRLLWQMHVWSFIHEAHFLLEDNLSFHSRKQFGFLYPKIIWSRMLSSFLWQKFALSSSMPACRSFSYDRIPPFILYLGPPGLLCQGTFWISEEGDHLGFHQYSG